MIDIAIIGGGPAGLSAGLYASRAGRNAVLFESLYSGGQITKTDNIENYPGFDEGADGFTIASKMEKQAVRFGLEIKNQSVTALELEGDVKKIICGESEYEARTVIIATGASPRPMGIPREQELVGAGISYCATCDGAFFRGKSVAVVGGGDTALSDALYLARFCERIYLVHRRKEYRAAAVLQNAVRAQDKIVETLGFVPAEILGEGSVAGLVVKDVKTQNAQTLDVSGIFIAVGVNPNTALVTGKLELNDAGYIVTDKYMQTPVEGVYAAGDVRDTPLRQVVTAAADGAVAATSAVERLMKL